MPGIVLVAHRTCKACSSERAAGHDHFAAVQPGCSRRDESEIIGRMNWLAHVFLSKPDVQFQLGNLLADVVRGPQRDAMSADFVHGAAWHKAIDAFTDAHLIVK